MDAGLEQRIRLLFKEAYRHKVMVAIGFLVISLGVASVGAAWPKSYSSSTTLLVEERSIINREENNARNRDDSADKLRTVQQILERRAVLGYVLTEGGWVDEATTPRELEDQLDAFQGRMELTNPAPNLVRIRYRDGDAERTYQTTKRLGEIVIDEMQGARTSQSRAAFQFIDRQVKGYEAELEETKAQLAALREQNPLARPGAEEQMAERTAQLRQRVEFLEQEAREARISERMLMSQLSGESDTTSSGGVDPVNARLSALRDELSDLRTRYTETYPDVVRLRQQIAELEESAEERRQQQSTLSPEEREAFMAEQTRDNPVFQQLQQELYETRTMIQRLDTRLEAQRQLLQQTQEQEQGVQELRDEMERLMRVYAVNSDIHQDLVRRRENARVSMQLDDEQQPFTLSIIEPAYMPHQPAGPRLVQFAAGGIVAGASVPLSLLFLFLLVDPRVRTGGNLPDSCSRRLLEVVPHVSTRRERIADGFKLVTTALIVCAGMLGVLAIITLRYLGQI